MAVAYPYDPGPIITITYPKPDIWSLKCTGCTKGSYGFKTKVTDAVRHVKAVHGFGEVRVVFKCEF